MRPSFASPECKSDEVSLGVMAVFLKKPYAIPAPINTMSTDEPVLESGVPAPTAGAVRRGLFAGAEWIRTSGTAAQRPWISAAFPALRGIGGLLSGTT